MAREQTESAGTLLKAAFLERYALNPGEAVMLDQACDLADLAERLAAEIRDQPLEGVGAAGQPVVHPLHRALIDVAARFAATIDALRLPDRPEGKLSNTARAQRAAFARWGTAPRKAG